MLLSVVHTINTLKRSNQSAFSAVKTIFEALEEKKAIHPIALDVSGVSPITDYTIIATGSVDRHLFVLATHIVDRCTEAGVQAPRVAGDPQGGWIVLDFGDVMVHCMLPYEREHYALERLWPEAEIVSFAD